MQDILKSMIPDLLKLNLTPNKLNNKCLHRQCSLCQGSGVNKLNNSVCVHALSCPCSQCSLYC
jgi:hypothetical protein